MNPDDLIAQRWEEDFRALHREAVQYGADMPTIIECYRETRAVAALFPSYERIHDALRLAPTFGSTAVLSMMDTNFHAISLDDEPPDDLPDADSAIMIAVTLPDGTNASRIYPYHVGNGGDVWHFDPLTNMDGLSGRMFESLIEGFKKTEEFLKHLGFLRTCFPELNEFEARVHADCAVTKALVSLGIEVRLWSEPGSDHIVMESFKDYEPPEPPIAPPPSMN